MMKLLKTYSLSLFALMVCSLLAAQDINVDNIRFRGEGAEDRFMMDWYLVKEWPEALDGFVVKKRLKDKEWSTVGPKDGFFPETKENSSLKEVIIGDAKAEKSLAAKVDHYIEEGKLKPKDRSSYKKDLIEKPRPNMFLRVNYDIVLLSGFGVIDAQFKQQSGTYEYGLFPIVNGKVSKEPTNILEWEYGTKPEISLEINNNAKSDMSIEHEFLFPKEGIDELNFRGFTVIKEYKTGEKDTLLNKNINNVGPEGYILLKTVESNLKAGTARDYHIFVYTFYGSLIPIGTYEMSAEETERPIRPKLAEIKLSIGKKDRFPILSWELKNIEEHQVKGYVIERAPDSAGYEVISDSLPAKDRSFHDTELVDGQYYSYRVSVLVKEKFKNKLEDGSSRKGINFY